MATCRDCSAPILWEELESGKKRAMDLDGRPHPATCPKSAWNMRPRLPDDVCLGCGSQDVERLPGQGPHYGAIKCRDCGQHRWLRTPA
jgi:DNA-directed RNA polymerase subunit RPC12/RpoP